jgi:hypothetical protein
MVEGKKRQHKGENDGRRERAMEEGRKCDHQGEKERDSRWEKMMEEGRK